MTTNKWYDQILTSVKSYFGMGHDASESEVHEKLQTQKNVAEAEEAIRQSAEADFTEQMKTREGAFMAEKTSLEQQIEAANSAASSLQEQVTALEGEIGLLQARILELESEAAPHTNGETETEPSAKQVMKSYEKDPITQKAMKIRSTQVHT